MQEFIVRDHPGIFENVYQILWSQQYKDSQYLQQDIKINPKFKLNLPQTIVFKEGIPVGWFFTSVSGSLLRRRRDNLHPKEIYAVLKKRAVCDIICYIIEEQKSQHHQRMNLKLRYLGLEELDQFLKYQRSHLNGIMQQFLPADFQDSIIQMSWSNSYHVINQIKAHGRINRQDLGMYYRAITFDPLEQYESRIPVYDQVLTNQIISTADKIVKKIRDNSFNNIVISRMNLYWKLVKYQPHKSKSRKKQGFKPKLYFLYATCVKTMNSKSTFGTDDIFVLNSKYSLDRSPALINYVSNPNKATGKKMSKLNSAMLKQECLNCQRSLPDSQFCDCEFKYVIKSHENERSKINWNEIFQQSEKHIRSQELIIPKLIQQLYPDLTVPSYEEQLRSHQFLRRTVKVCELCYVDLTKDEELPHPQEVPPERQMPNDFRSKLRLDMIHENRQFLKSMHNYRLEKCRCRQPVPQTVSDKLSRQNYRSSSISTKTSELLYLLRVPSVQEKNKLERVLRKFKRLQLKSAEPLTRF